MPRRRKIDRLPGMRTTGLLIAAAALGGCSSSRAPIDKNQFTIQRIASPAAAGGSSEPQLTVTGDRAILSWVETTGASATLKFAERTGGGWSPPHQAAAGDDWFLSWADVPSVPRHSIATAARLARRSSTTACATAVRPPSP